MFRLFIIGLLAALLPNVTMAQVTGAGATFPYPVYAKWAQAYKEEMGISINYQSIGSGAGIKQIKSKTVIFGATDMPLPQNELDEAGLVQFPMVIGGVVLGVNLGNISPTLTPEIVASIYLGKIKMWNDPEIAKLNPGITLPPVAITIIRRSDGSGTNYLFTKFLSDSSKEFKDKIGIGTSVSWPVGVGAKGNEGVANNLKIMSGSIGYVEYAYAKQNKLTMANLMLNGSTVSPSANTFQSGKWPIAAPTYILMYKDSGKADLTKIALHFFEWAIDKGDAMAMELDYIPLSDQQKEANRVLWKTIK